MANYLLVDEIVFNLLQFVPLVSFRESLSPLLSPYNSLASSFILLFSPFPPTQSVSLSGRISSSSRFFLSGYWTGSLGSELQRQEPMMWSGIEYRLAFLLVVPPRTVTGAWLRLICYVKTSIASILPPPPMPPPPPRVAEEQRERE